ncbi:CotH kinase family protein [Bacillus sp. JJ1764]|uniref:CotH kinase family protein n=1 Tax=Bacillus sp. JJ1764 TaxID=3122964 RepID=UPI002FFE34EA
MDEAITIPHYKLFIRPVDLKELKRDIWKNTPLPAQLSIDGKRLDIDVCYRGSHIRDFPKKSYQISFYKPAYYRGSKLIHLNAEYKDPSMIRNKLSFDFFSELGCLSPNSRHVCLTLNGKMEGVYLEIESVDEFFLKRRNLPGGSIFYAIDGDANFSLMSDLDKNTKKSLKQGYEKKCGKDDYYLEEMIFKINTIPRNEFEREIQKYVDVEKYLRWMAGIIFTSNYDGFVHNYSLFRSSETGLFEMIPWDYDATWGRDVNGKLMDADYVPIKGFNTLTARLLDVDHFRRRYRDLIIELLAYPFSKEFIAPRAEKLLNEIRPFLLMDPYKNKYIDVFDWELDVILRYIEERRVYLQTRLYKLL